MGGLPWDTLLTMTRPQITAFRERVWYHDNLVFGIHREVLKSERRPKTTAHIFSSTFLFFLPFASPLHFLIICQLQWSYTILLSFWNNQNHYLMAWQGSPHFTCSLVSLTDERVWEMERSFSLSNSLSDDEWITLRVRSCECVLDVRIPWSAINYITLLLHL